jgi:hypothetical protein
MTVFLLEIREKIRIFYAKYGTAIIMLGKFLIALWSVYYIDSTIGYNVKLTLLPIVLGIALVGAVLPASAFPIIVAILVLIHLYTLSLEVTLTTAAIFLMMLLIYIIFMPENGFVIVLVPLLFSIKIPYLLPLILGLMGSVSAIIPMSYGVIGYYLIQYVSGSATVLVETNSLGKLEKYMQLVNGLKDNYMLYSVIIAFVVTLLVTMLIKSLPIAYAPIFAIITGVILQMIVLLSFNLLNNGAGANISLAEIVIGCIVSGCIAILYQLVIRSVDYKRTESIQFEDDEYYYYVKAVPKIAVTESNIQVKKIVRRDEEKVNLDDSEV